MHRLQLRNVLHWVLIASLVGSNAIALLPRGKTLSYFARPRATLSSIHLELSHRETTSLCVVDHSGILHVRSHPLPARVLQNAMNRRRINYVVHHACIALWVRALPDQQETCVGVYSTRDTWEPIGATSLRFMLKDVLKLAPGNYAVRAVIFAEPPHGAGQRGVMRESQRIALSHRAIIPGAVFLETASTLPIKLTIESTADAGGG